jgi:hypothetical protein
MNCTMERFVNDHDSLLEPEDPSDWLVELLKSARGARPPAIALKDEDFQAFRQSCRHAGGTALILTRLQQEREQVGFVPLAFQDYVEGLAQVVGASLSGVMTWLGLKGWPQLDEAGAEAMARLGHVLGMSLRQILAHVRISFAREWGIAPMPLLLARHRGKGGWREPLEECEKVLEQVETSYDARVLRELRMTQSALQTVYHALAGKQE